MNTSKTILISSGITTMTKHQKSSLIGAIRAYSKEQQALLDNDRPTAELLDAYFHDQLSDIDRSQVARRISLDVEFADEILDRQQQAMHLQKQEDWQALASRAEAEGLAVRSSNAAVPYAVRLKTANRWVYAVAAGWILTVVGLGFWIYRLETAKASGSVNLASRGMILETHVLSLTLRPDESRRNIEGAEPTIRIDTMTERVTLFLLNADMQPYTRYSIELRDLRGTLLTEGFDLRREGDGSFTISLDPTPLSSGRHELVVLGRDEREPKIIGRYPFHIEMVTD